MSEDTAGGGQHEALVPPHASEVVPPTPSRIREVWHPGLSTMT
ncbi:hypothetical protein OHA18_26535 [Kribbella sp. NBC_00709]|nr:hypothetical protein [Kribbella sp. NBC_00709]